MSPLAELPADLDLGWSIETIDHADSVFKLITNARRESPDAVSYDVVVVQMVYAPWGEASGALTCWQENGHVSRKEARQAATHFLRKRGINVESAGLSPQGVP